VRKHNLAIEQKHVVSLESKGSETYDLHLEGGQTLKTKTVIIATGASPVALDVPGEREFTGRGISYCATCDGPLFRDKEIMVVGGGNSALEETLFLTRFAKKVTIIHRRDAFRGDKILQDRVLRNPKVHLFWTSKISEIRGDSRVREIVIRNLSDQSMSVHKLDGLFVYIGTRPNTGWLSSMVQSDEGGYIITDEKLSTNLPGIFAAGDCRRKMLRQIVTAAGDGALAGMMAYQYIQGLQEKKA
jgi:thioredoxin reductase (NADPH)